MLQKPSVHLVLLGGTSGEEPACRYRRLKRNRFDPWVGKLPWRREWLTTPVFLPGEFHKQRRNLAYYSPWGPKELNMNEQLTLSLSFYL